MNANDIRGAAARAGRRWRVRLGVLVLALLAACDGDGAALDKARVQLAKGDLERAGALAAAIDGPEARDLERAIDAAREQRAELEARLDELLDRSVEEPPNRIRGQLDALLDGERDPVSRRRIEQVQSDLVDLVAERRAAARERPTAEPSKRPVATVLGADAERMAEVIPAAKRPAGPDPRAAVRAAMAEGEWAAAADAIERLSAAGDIDGTDAIVLAHELDEAGRSELDRLVGRAREMEERHGLEAAVQHLAAEAARFPRTGELAAFHGELEDMRRKLETLRQRPLPGRWAPDADAAAAAPVPAGLGPEQVATRAREAAAAGRLEEARRLWLAAGERSELGRGRDAFFGEAEDLRGRLALREELAGAIAVRPELFGDLSITSANEDGWVREGARVAWSDVRPISLERAAALVPDLSDLARRGLFCERLASARGDARQRMLDEDLAELVETGAIAPGDAAEIAGRAMGAGAPADLVWTDGGLVRASEHEEELLAERNEELTVLFVQAREGEREASLDALVVRGDPELLVAALRRRGERFGEVLRAGGTLDQLRRVADLRRELDEARASALTLIFDVDTYFYPYDPPPAPKTTTDYVRAQREVDVRVGRVRELWKKSREVDVPTKFRGAIEELRWIRARFEPLEAAFQCPEGVPAWVLAIGPETESVDLESFAWSEAEAAELALSRRIRARNEALWEAIDDDRLELAKAARPGNAEEVQVRITNDYRALLGRHALAWNPRLQAAAQGHSEYMGNTGDFGHFEKDPARRTPADRMRLEGYEGGGGENCHAGGGDPRGAHDGWTHSSGHHRNLLSESHREMASAVAGAYWTQNFGTGTAFLEDLEQ